MDRQAFRVETWGAAPLLLTLVTSVTWIEGRAFEQGLQRQREADRNCLAIHMNSLKPFACTCSHSVKQKWSKDFHDLQGTFADSQGVGNLGAQSLLHGKGLHEIPLIATSTLADHSATAVCGFSEVGWRPLDNIRGDYIRTQQGQEGPPSL